MFYVLSTSIGYWVIKDLPGLAPMMGGSGDFSKIFDGYPAWQKPEYLDLFYLVSLGYHVNGFVYHLFGPKNNDYVEMILHHSATTALIYFSYLLNFQHIGVLVYWLHDWADIPGTFARFTLDLPNSLPTVVSVLSTVVVWGYS